ncbi:hypothetical protein KJ662_05565 [Patescibacteria group bacterium]|nr:hypothetical protein [Patescibacteria group bacterium]
MKKKCPGGKIRSKGRGRGLGTGKGKGPMNKRWIQDADLKEGALRETASREGALNEDGTISVTWLRKKASGKGKTAQRARLALRFRSFKK